MGREYYRKTCYGCDEVRIATGVEDKGRMFCGKYAFTVTDETAPIDVCDVRVRSNSIIRGRVAPAMRNKLTLKELVKKNAGRT